ncbi:MAG TPA: GMC family oxidoreductase N-terminal domain-containing protein [Gemmatimonadaceae bacterium]
MLDAHPARRRTLDAVCRRILSYAYDGEDADLAAATPPVDVAAARIARLPAPLARDLELALDIFGSRAAALLSTGRPTPFSELDPRYQDAMLSRWERSSVPTMRTIYQALRRVVVASWYAIPEVQHGIGYLGPFHPRGAAVPWEGALAGREDDAEPVARVADPARESIPATARDAAARHRASPPRAGVLAGASLRDGMRLVCDAVVVGTGAGGAVAAARLAEAGHEVVMLEAGSLLGASDFDEREGPLTERLYAEGCSRATQDLSFSLFQGASVGGGTTVNWLVMLRTPGHVLDEWRLRHGAEGMTPAEMAPVFERVEREVHARRVPDDAHSPNNRIILDGARTLGWRAAPAVINAKGCVRSGFCGLGCRYDAKQGALLTYVPRALARGARLVPDARAERIEVAERSTGGRLPLKRVHATHVDPATGLPRARFVVDAPVVVVAGGAVETPALLARSGMGGGGLGRFLRLHPTTAVIARYDHAMHASAGIPLSVVCDEFARRDENGYGFWIECPPTHPMLAAASLPGFGAAHRARVREYPRLGVLIALTRDGAERERSSGDVRVGRDGLPRIRYRLSPADARHVAESIEASARLHLAAGAREVTTLHADPPRIREPRDLAVVRERSVAPNRLAMFSAHVNGTCRIGTDPRTSGTTPEGERHGARGVFVADGSLLPTAPGVNPQETIMALATIVAGRIAARL